MATAHRATRADAIIDHVLPVASHLLLLDTCGSAGTVALAALNPQPRILGQQVLPGRSASERLLPALRGLLAEQQTALESLAAIAVVTGPGSFTGVRVGLSAAKGIAEALAIPLVALSGLAVLAGKTPAHEVLAVLDAGRSEYYCGHYLAGECMSEALRSRDAVLSLASAMPDASVIACEPAVAEALGPLSVRLIPELTAQEALTLAVLRLRSREFADPVTLDANYVRRTDAELFVRPPRAGSGSA